MKCRTAALGKSDRLLWVELGHTLTRTSYFRSSTYDHPLKAQSGIPLWSPSGLVGQSTQRSARASSCASLSG
ncbi:MAG: hypothetical protein JWQ50_297 [Caballeronia mineralivorans]|jgi:hypothetical protein|nr:hypothetical protein [Caballeronia mineralivorans]MEA3100861.1 hypothetical protein [Caballeronia mineralivorans]